VVAVPRVILPLPVTLKRFAALLLVFSFIFVRCFLLTEPLPCFAPALVQAQSQAGPACMIFPGETPSRYCFFLGAKMVTSM